MTPLRSLVALLALAVPAALRAQLPRPHLDWRTRETPHFVFHYPAEAERWTVDLASRMEAVSEAVTALVGSGPRRRVTIVVEDPLTVSNGSAWPVLDRPVIYLWPTPATARSSIGHSRGWAEELAVHEFAHIAHLTRPSRNWRQRLFWRLSPLPAGPVATRAPRWAFEGYATYVEGRLTGSGRPYGAARAAALRQWALEGELPKYAQLNGTGGYRGGEMAYLAGSAFFEWLIERTGEASLPNVWRRLSARQRRTFDQAFAGVYGATPAALYGRFTAELTGRALAAERELAADSAGTGTLVLGPRGYGYDDPAVSPDGSRIAVRVRGTRRPGPVLVVRAAADTLSARERRARSRLLARDPEDVLAVDFLPRPHRVVARLDPTQETGYEEPRFFADGKRVLVARWTGRADGSVRPDLYEWTLKGGRVRRVTDGAGVRDADPAPDGSRAVAVRCSYGVCDLVSVDLRTGGLTVITPGSVDRVFDRPRFSPDGRTIAVAVQEGGRWRVRLLDAVRGTPVGRELAAADSASRYEPAFTRDGRELLVTSERGGVPNIEAIDLATGAARTLTTVSGAAAAPAASGDTLAYYLNLRAEGLELRSVPLARSRGLAPLVRDSGLAPALPLRATAVADTFARGPVGAPRDYGLGPRGLRYLPSQSGGSEGSVYALAFVSADPVSRLTLVAQGGLGDRETWRGGALGASYRGRRPAVEGELFSLQQEPSRGGSAPGTVPDTRRYTGGTAALTLLNSYGWRTARYHAGASAGKLRLNADDDPTRALGFAEYAGSYQFTLRGLRLGAGTAVHGSLGRTGDASWRRGLGVLEGRAELFGVALAARGTLGALNGDAPAFEQFAAGGIDVPFVDPAVLSQRVAVPALPVGFAAGRRLGSYRFATTFAGFEPYYLAVAAGERVRGWTRVIGAEQRVAAPPIGLLGLPATEILAGIGYPLTGPYRYETQLYGGLTVRP
jgi:hypothetical protein